MTVSQTGGVPISSSLALIAAYRRGEPVRFEEHPWLKLLVEAEERQVNLERFRSVQEVAAANPVLDYVERTLQILQSLHVSFWIREVVESVLIWSEAAKGGTYRERKALQQDGVNLYVHNVGSAQLYQRHAAVEAGSKQELIYTLILTHGLVGQHLRGEVPLSRQRPLSNLIDRGVVSGNEARDLLLTLNQCVIGGVAPELWEQLHERVAGVIEQIVTGTYDEPGLTERLRRLRARSIASGEPFDQACTEHLQDPRVIRLLEPLAEKDLWYVEPALSDFSFAEFLKVLLLICREPQFSQVSHINFEPLMKSLHYDYRGEKRVNLFRKRVIERYLRQFPVEEIISGAAAEVQDEPHLTHQVETYEGLPDTLFFQFAFTPVAEALINFCLEAEQAGTKYQQAIILLYDFFQFRRDAYDRFHNEERYLSDMNRTVNYKRLMLEYVVGDTVLDVGPGGGAMLDLIAESFPQKRAFGIDIAQNVVEALRRKQELEGRHWRVIQGDALDLKQHFEPGSVSTVLFSSVLHELFSYIPFEGKRFNLKTVASALQSAFDILPPGGRIVIRDGIMTEPEDQQVIVRFKAEDGMKMLHRFAAEFQGRPIPFEIVGHNEVAMRVNDAMEFLYTYTWGEEAFAHEVQEQFGYLTPSGYARLIRDALGEQAEILVNNHFLQDGYTLALSPKIEFYDPGRNPIPLPDSTCLIVVEKKGTVI